VLYPGQKIWPFPSTMEALGLAQQSHLLALDMYVRTNASSFTSRGDAENAEDEMFGLFRSSRDVQNMVLNDEVVKSMILE
jgi:hypothetical protein